PLSFSLRLSYLTDSDHRYQKSQYRSLHLHRPLSELSQPSRESFPLSSPLLPLRSYQSQEGWQSESGPLFPLVLLLPHSLPPYRSLRRWSASYSLLPGSRRNHPPRRLPPPSSWKRNRLSFCPSLPSCHPRHRRPPAPHRLRHRNIHSLHSGSSPRTQ